MQWENVTGHFFFSKSITAHHKCYYIRVIIRTHLVTGLRFCFLECKGWRSVGSISLCRKQDRVIAYKRNLLLAQ
jgi:hypothetical protein